jgi:hypothetical protein
MSTTVVRIPVPQYLWDKFRKAGSDHLLAKLDHARMSYIYSGTDSAGSAAELDALWVRVSAAAAAEFDARMVLAKAQADHVMGTP